MGAADATVHRDHGAGPVIWGLDRLSLLVLSRQPNPFAAVYSASCTFSSRAAVHAEYFFPALESNASAVPASGTQPSVALSMSGQAQMTANEAGANGGALAALRLPVTAALTGNASIARSLAGGAGGSIYIRRHKLDLSLSGNASMAFSRAGAAGGCVSMSMEQPQGLAGSGAVPGRATSGASDESAAMRLVTDCIDIRIS